MKTETTSLVRENDPTPLLRPALLVALCTFCAIAVAMTVIAATPPGLDRWAQLLTPIHRHHRHVGMALDPASVRGMFESAFYACWAAAWVLALGLSMSWRLLFGGLHRWGTHDRS